MLSWPHVLVRCTSGSTQDCSPTVTLTAVSIRWSRAQQRSGPHTSGFPVRYRVKELKQGEGAETG